MWINRAPCSNSTKILEFLFDIFFLILSPSIKWCYYAFDFYHLNVLKAISNRIAIQICCILLFNVVVNIEEFSHFFTFLFSKYLKTNANSAKNRQKSSNQSGQNMTSTHEKHRHLEIRLEFFKGAISFQTNVRLSLISPFSMLVYHKRYIVSYHKYCLLFILFRSFQFTKVWSSFSSKSPGSFAASSDCSVVNRLAFVS